MSLVVVKAFIREVLLSAVQLVLNGLPNNLLGIEVIQEMVVGQSGVVKQVYEERRVSNETTSYEGVWERLDAHRVVVEWKQRVYVKLVFQSFFWVSRLFTESAHVEFPVIVVNGRVILAISCLLHFFKFDILAFLSPDLLLKSAFVRLQVILINVMLIILILRNCDGFRGVVSDDHGGDRVQSVHICLLNQILEDIRVVLKSWIWFIAHF